jgi:hypothetical protein
MNESMDIDQILNRLPDLKGLSYHIAEVRGSSPLLPTMTAICKISEELANRQHH